MKKRADEVANRILAKYGKLISLKFISEKEFHTKSAFIEEIKKGKVIYHGG